MMMRSASATIPLISTAHVRVIMFSIATFRIMRDGLTSSMPMRGNPAKIPRVHKRVTELPLVKPLYHIEARQNTREQQPTLGGQT